MPKAINRRKLKRKLVAALALLVVCLLSGSCASVYNFDKSLNSIVKPYSFSILQWELKAIPSEINQWVFAKHGKIDDEIDTVMRYFSLVDQIDALKSELEAINNNDEQSNKASTEIELAQLQEQKTALEDVVERIIEKQISETLVEQSIINPLDRFTVVKIIFPPVHFQLEALPYLLVISPRDRIEYIRGITLEHSISLHEIEDIETRVDQLGVSSLVVKLGGLGATYPSLVSNDAGLQFTINNATEEWVHQYLTFKPLGFLYLLHVTSISRDYEIVTINETLASMASKEIGSIICEKHYPDCASNENLNRVPESAFDFNREMREIRRTVDRYLAQGEIEQAEEFMEQKRQYLATKGYYIRKLNQAYFAFYGTYADSPTSISPIGLELEDLRNQSVSLKDFLDSASSITSRHELIELIK